MHSVFKLLQGACVFYKLYLHNAYRLVRIREGDEWKMGFNTLLGHIEYLVMLFGLTNTPALYQALVIDVLQDSPNHFVFAYLDEILIFFAILVISCLPHMGHSPTSATCVSSIPSQSASLGQIKA